MNNLIRPLFFVRNTCPVEISKWCSTGTGRKYNFLSSLMILDVEGEKQYVVKTCIYRHKPELVAADKDAEFDSVSFKLTEKILALTYMKTLLMVFKCREFDILEFDKQDRSAEEIENFVRKWIKQTNQQPITSQQISNSLPPSGGISPTMP